MPNDSYASICQILKVISVTNELHLDVNSVLRTMIKVFILALQAAFILMAIDYVLIVKSMGW